MNDQIIIYLSVGCSFLAIVFAIYGTIKRGIRKKINFLGIVIDVNLYDKNNCQSALDQPEKAEEKVTPFEIKQLERNYRLIHQQALFSYWVSMVFTIAVGLLMLIKYCLNSENTGIFIVCQAINSLFLYGSNRAQKRMMDCNNKLSVSKEYVEEATGSWK